ncbi:gliding motility-associated C-terminal domain-containing protein [Hymenobacter chitinivorans]|nr:gliding motility-associated C-terminal domain-containing protein [Hymenobacter chitinivorans]
MQKLLHAAYLLAVACCLSLLGLPAARASHIQGGQLTYEALGNNRYKVSLTVFRDCGGAGFNMILPTLNYSSTGCAAGPELPMTLAGTAETGVPYCANIPGGPAQCGPGLLTNYQKGTFEATITLPPAAEWIISVSLNARPPVANINAGNGNLYYEARLNNLLPNGSQIQNTSAQYQAQDIPIPFVCKSQERTVSFATTEPDGDSLVYSLAPALQGCSEPNTYKSYVGNGPPFIDLTPPGGVPCGAYITDNQGSYSPTYPLASYNVTGACPLKTATKAFNFDPSLGTFSFIPANHTKAPDSPDNKYVVVGQVTEYRKFAGPNGKPVYYKVGQVRRDMLVVVIDCENNNQPSPPIGSGFDKSSVQIVNSRDSTFVTAYTCNYTEVRFRFTDPNPGDILTVTHPELDPSVPSLTKPTYLPADVATFQLRGNGTSTPTGILRIQPDVAFLGKTYRIPVKIEDNACPIKGVQYRVIVLKIAKGNFARVLAPSANPVICAGTSIKLTATPFRPDSVGSLPAAYGYQWEAANGLPPNQRDKAEISVAPTVTTRYKVRILGLSFRVGTCSDTASVLVRVQQPIRTAAAAAQPVICVGSTTTITAAATRPQGDAQEKFSYQWAAANGLSPADLSKPTISVRPTMTTRYKLTITGDKATGCGLDTTSVLVRVQQRIVPKLTADAASLCAGNTARIAATATRPQGDAQEKFSYQWAAANGLSPADLSKPTISVRPTTTTRYKLTITGDKTTCTPDTASWLVRVQQPLRAVATTSAAVICSGSTAGITATASRPEADQPEVFTYQWAAANGLSVADQSKPSITVRPTTTTRYKLTVTGSRATACGPDTTSVLVRVAEPVRPSFTADSAALPGRSILLPPLVFTFTNTSTLPGQPAATVPQYRWSSQRIITGKGQAVSEPEQFFSTESAKASRQFDVAGVYRIRLRVGVSINGAASCQETLAEVNIRVPESRVPNVFTPNGDGLNDLFVLSSEPTNSKLQIFNRSGRLIREYAQYNNDWDGENQPAGVYYYLLTGKNGTTTKGWVELVR